MAAALVSTVLGVAVTEEREKNAYVEGIAIWVAVLVVSLVGERRGQGRFDAVVHVQPKDPPT